MKVYIYFILFIYFKLKKKMIPNATLPKQFSMIGIWISKSISFFKKENTTIKITFLTTDKTFFFFSV